MPLEIQEIPNKIIFKKDNVRPLDSYGNVGDRVELLNGNLFIKSILGWKLIESNGIPITGRVSNEFSELDNIDDYKIGEKISILDRGVDFKVIEAEKPAIRAYTSGNSSQCASYRQSGLNETINIGDEIRIGIYMDSSLQSSGSQCVLLSFDDDNAKGRFAFRPTPSDINGSLDIFSADNSLWTRTKVEDYNGNDLTSFYGTTLPANKWYYVTFTSLVDFSYSSLRLFNFVPNTVEAKINYLKVGAHEFLIEEDSGESISSVGDTITLTNEDFLTSPSVFLSGIDSNNFDLIMKNGYSLKMNITDNKISPQMLGYTSNETKAYNGNDIAPFLQQCIDSKYDVVVPSGNNLWITPVNVRKPKKITFEGAVLQDMQNAYGNFTEAAFDYVGNKEACVLYTNVDNLNMLNIQSSNVKIYDGNFDLVDVQNKASAIRFDANYRIKDVYINHTYFEGNLSRLSMGELEAGYSVDNGAVGIWFDSENATVDGGYFFKNYIVDCSGYYLRQGVKMNNFSDNPVLNSFFNNGQYIDFNGDGCSQVMFLEGLNNSTVKSYSQDRPHFNFTDSTTKYPFHLNIGDSFVDVFMYDANWGSTHTIIQLDTFGDLPLVGVNTTTEYYIRDERISYRWNGSNYVQFATGYTHYALNIYNPRYNNTLFGRAATIYDFRTRQLNTDLGRYQSVAKGIHDIIYDNNITRNLNNVLSHAALEGTVTAKVYDAGADFDWIENGTNLYPANDAVNNPDGALAENLTPTGFDMSKLMIGNVDDRSFGSRVTLGATEFLEIHINNPKIVSNLNRFLVITNNNSVKYALILNGSTRRGVLSNNGNLVTTAEGDNPKEFILRIYGDTSSIELRDIYATTKDDVNLSVISKNGGTTYGNFNAVKPISDLHAHLDINDDTTYEEISANVPSYQITKPTIYLKNTHSAAITLNFSSSFNNRYRGSLILIQLASDSEDIIFDVNAGFDFLVSLSGQDTVLSGGDWMLVRLQSSEGIPDRAMPYEIANSLPIATSGITSGAITVDGTAFGIINGLITSEVTGTPDGTTTLTLIRENRVLLTNANGIVIAKKILFPDGTPASPSPNNGSVIPASGAIGEFSGSTVVISEDSTEGNYDNGKSSILLSGNGSSFANARFRVPSIQGETFTVKLRAKTSAGQGRLRAFNGVDGDTQIDISSTTWTDVEFVTTAGSNNSHFDLTFYARKGSGDSSGDQLWIDDITITPTSLLRAKVIRVSSGKSGNIINLRDSDVYNMKATDTKNYGTYEIQNPKVNNSARCLVQFTAAEIAALTNNKPSFTGFTVTEVASSVALVADEEMYMTLWCDDDTTGSEIIRMKINAL